MSVNIYTSLPLALTANLINRFLHLFLSSIRECLFGVNTYTSLPLALTANLITTVFYLFLRTDKLELLVYSDTKIIFCICTHCIFEKSNIVIRNTKILQTIPPQNRYNFKPSYLKKLFLLSSSSRIFCFITLVSVSDCFSRSFVALCIASIFACNAFLTSWTVFSLTSSFRLPISPDIAS